MRLRYTADHKSFISQFVRHLNVERELAISTISTYRHHVSNYLGFLEGRNIPNTPFQSESPSHYLAHRKGRGLKPHTLFGSFMAISSFHRFLKIKGFVEIDPTEKMSPPKLVARAPEPLSSDEVDKLLSAPRGSDPREFRDKVVMEFTYLGLRISEALGLDINHVHLKDGYLKVYGKGSRERLVPIGGQAKQVLEKYLTWRSQKYGATGPLFISQKGQRLSKSGFWRRFKSYVGRSGIKQRVYPHLMRHNFAVHMLKGKADLCSLQLLLGHASLSSTQKYLNLDWDSLKETCEKAHPRF